MSAIISAWISRLRILPGISPDRKGGNTGCQGRLSEKRQWLSGNRRGVRISIPGRPSPFGPLRISHFRHRTASSSSGHFRCLQSPSLPSSFNRYTHEKSPLHLISDSSSLYNFCTGGSQRSPADHIRPEQRPDIGRRDLLGNGLSHRAGCHTNVGCHSFWW